MSTPTSRVPANTRPSALVRALVTVVAMLSWSVQEAVTPARAATTEAAWKNLVGAYRFSGGDAERRALDAAIEDVVADMNFLFRDLARDRLRASNPIPQRLAISSEGDLLTVKMDARTYTAPIDGTPVRVVGITGNPLTMRFRIEHGRIQQSFSGDNGRRQNTYAAASEGRLTLHVRVSSERLPKDLDYHLTFARTQ